MTVEATLWPRMEAADAAASRKMISALWSWARKRRTGCATVEVGNAFGPCAVNLAAASLWLRPETSASRRWRTTSVVRACQSAKFSGFTAVTPLSVVPRSEEHTSELQSLMRISYAVFCLKKKNTHLTQHTTSTLYRTN